MDDEWVGDVYFLPWLATDAIIDSGTVPADILAQCLEIDNAYVYNEYPEITDRRDIENL